MKLHRIELTDFRQFKGRQTLDLASGSPENVTVIYGENGRGKTGIFRALMFCLYGDKSLSQDGLTGDKKKEGLRLVNEVSCRENKDSQVEARVTVHFSHQQCQFQITRKILGLLKDDGEYMQQDPPSMVELQKTAADGNTLPVEIDPDKITVTIQDILNSRLRDYFLFDGERIERLTRNTKERRDEVRQGIRVLLDLDAMELAIKGLDKLISKVEKEIKYKSTGKLQSVTALIDELNTEIDDFESRQDQDGQELKRLEHHIRKLSEEIRDNKETAEKERQRQELKVDRQNKKVERDELRKDVGILLNRSGQLVASELIEQLREELDFRREKGQLPPDVREEFVEKLLQQGKCICGTLLDQDHKSQRECLEDFLKQHYAAGLGQESLTLLLDLKGICGENEGLGNEHNRLLVKNKKLYDEIQDLDRKIKRLSDELGEGGTDIDDLIQDRAQCEEELKKLEKMIDHRDIEKSQAKQKRDDLRKDAQVLEKQQEQVHRYVAKRDLAIDTKKELDSVYRRFATEVKQKLAAKSTEVFSVLADEETRKDIRKISIDDNYMLDVLNWAGQRRLGEISAGQRQIVSLSFIMALIKVAGDLEVPLFMDTPFGRLSGTHRDHLLDTIPRIAPQWILLATDTEFTRVEADALRQTNAWGKIYELVKEEEGITNIVERAVSQFEPRRKTI